MSPQIQIVQKYLDLVQNLELSENSSAELLHHDYTQWEFPNLLNKHGQKSDRLDSFKRINTAKMILINQHYEVTNTVESNQTVIIETIWTGTMAIEAGPLKKGQTLKAYFCMFFEFKDGKIYQVRNYDCFEPLS